MITISLAMIVKDEEKTIERCLNSVRNIVDEIIIVDTGSTDRTKELCLKYTDKVFDFKWIEDFAAARNHAFSCATMDYIMWLDADDILLPEDNIKFLELKQSLSKDVDVVMMKYATGLDSKGNVIFSYYRERLSKREKNCQWMEPVHEYLQISGNIINSDITITHAKPNASNTLSDRNLKIYKKQMKSGRALSPRGNYYYARELKDHGYYKEAVEQFTKFLDQGAGWIEDNINACSEIAKCYLLLEQPKKALEALYKSFIYDTPRGEICCQIGYYYQNTGDYKRAAFWFNFILSLEKPEGNWGFLQPDCWGYIPLIECAVCYDRLGDYQKAMLYNQLALEMKPDSSSALSNKKYFEEKMKKT